MFATVLKKVFGSANERAIRRYRKTVEQINALEASMVTLSDAELKERSTFFKSRLAAGESLNDILPEAFATAREAAKRVLNMRPFDVQLIGGMVLHEGKIAEMKTGEGKTLVATLPVYLNALTGKGVHLVTINDYLAKRDSSWMGMVYSFLGLKVGCIVHGLSDEQRREAYAADVTYGTNHEFGFDYLRDNMKFDLREMVMRPFNYAIVDEVDSILVDEARTPLIISGPTEDSSELYMKVNVLMQRLRSEDYEKDEKQRTVMLTEAGVEHVELMLNQAGLLKGQGLYDLQNISLVHHVNQALRAHKLFQRDVDYIVKDNKIIIIDEFTGRMMEGRRYSEGLHQSLEAKENVKVELENQTLASITYQNFFRLYPKLAGMTGTAITEATEFDEIYKLAVVEVPTNVAVSRKDYDDEVYLTAKEKYNAVIQLIQECCIRKQPVLVGTTSIEKSEFLSKLLKNAGISHNVLNARYHEQEAMIIADAGQPGTVTIATNMAGRGTDIKLGGNFEMRVSRELINETKDREQKIEHIRQEILISHEKVKQAGGLYVIGTERHESRRIDNQLRGRSGRQGDPGASKFFVSLEDDLMRIFGSDRLDSMLRRLGVKEGEAISHNWISKALERAQQKVEARNFDTRKHLLRYDNVMNDQRKIVYEQRRELMDATDVAATIQEIQREVIESLVKTNIPENTLAEQWNASALKEACKNIFSLTLPIEQWFLEEGITEQAILQRVSSAVEAHMAQKESLYSSEFMRVVEKTLLLRILDQAWKEHLLILDHLRQGINLRAYAQGNPLNEYKQEAFQLFKEMLDYVRQQVIMLMAHFEVALNTPEEAAEMLTPHPDFAKFEEQEPGWVGESGFRPVQPAKAHDPKDPASWGKISRNAACPCNSGKKYKHCHGTMPE